MVCWMVARYIFIMISDPQRNVGIHFLMKCVLQHHFLYYFTCSINQFVILNLFSFLFHQTFLLINSICLFWPLYLLPSTSYPYDLFPRFWRSVLEVSCIFLDTVHAGYRVYKPCHVPHASRIATSGTIFTEICFGVSKEYVKSW